MTKLKKFGSKFLEALGQPLVAVLLSLLVGAVIIGLSGAALHRHHHGRAGSLHRLALRL